MDGRGEASHHHLPWVRNKYEVYAMRAFRCCWWYAALLDFCVIFSATIEEVYFSKWVTTEDWPPFVALPPHVHLWVTRSRILNINSCLNKACPLTQFQDKWKNEVKQSLYFIIPALFTNYHWCSWSFMLKEFEGGVKFLCLKANDKFRVGKRYVTDATAHEWCEW